MGGSSSKTSKQKTDIKTETGTTIPDTTIADTTEDLAEIPVTARTIIVQAASSQWEEESDSHAQDSKDTDLKEQCERDISDTDLTHSQQYPRQKAAEASVLQHSTDKLRSLPGNSMTNTGRGNSVRPTANGNRVTHTFHVDSLIQTVPDKTNTNIGPQKSFSHQSIYRTKAEHIQDDHQLANMTREIQELREERDTMASVNRDLTQDMQGLRNKLVQKDTELDELRTSARTKAVHIQDDHQLANMTREIQELREERDILASVNKDLRNKLVQKDTELDELRTRLSRVASERLTDNPNIADLSDPNRPLKIAEMYKELYNNEWSDAFDDLAATGQNDKEKIHILLKFIKDIYKLCFGVSQQLSNDLKTQIVMFTGTWITDNLSSAMKAFKDERKKQFRVFLPQLTMDMNKMADTQLARKERTVKLQKYLDLSTELCWLMCIQDPPIQLHTDCKKGADFDETRFTAFTVRGITVSYLVWPAILLHENGPVLMKGVAQAKKNSLKKNKSKSK